MKTNFFKKFIYLTAVQVILVSQLLVIATALTTSPILAESGSGSEGTVTEESTSGSNSGSSSEENTGSGTSGGDTQQAPAEETTGQVTEEEPAPATEEAAVTEEVEEPLAEEPEEVIAEEPTAGGEEAAANEEAEAEPIAAEEPVADEEPAAEEPVAGEEPAAEEPIVGDEEVVADEEATVGTADEAAAATTTEAGAFPASYQDQTGTTVVPCLDGSDPNCVLPEAGEEAGFDPSQSTQLGLNFPSEIFYWVAESDKLDTPLGGKTFLTLALEGAFVNEEPLAGDEMVFGRIRLTGTDLQPNSIYTVTHPYGVDTYETNDEGIITRGEGTEDIGACEATPCDFTAALDSRIFQSFLSWDTGAPEGYLGDGVTLHNVTGSPAGNNFFRIEGAGLPEGGLFTDLFIVAGKLLSGAGSAIGDLVGGGTTGEEPTGEEPVDEEVEEEEEEEETTVDEEAATEEGAANGGSENSGSTGNSDSSTAGEQQTAGEQTSGNSSTTETTGSSSTGNTTSDNSNQSSGNQTQTSSGNSDNSGNSTSGSTGGSSEAEQRGSVAEGEIRGVDEEQLVTGTVPEEFAEVLGAEDFVPENTGILEASLINTEAAQSQPVNTAWIILAMVFLGLATGLSVWGSTAGGFNIKRLKLR